MTLATKQPAAEGEAVPGPRHHLLSVLVENRSGVLARVAGLFARRGYNIFSLAVAPTEDEALSRISIVVDVESTPLAQIVAQLDKLVNVVEISELHPAAAREAELLLATVVAGPPEGLDDFEELVRPYGLQGVQRTGRVALPRLRNSRSEGPREI